jgi:hypothetical protein
MSLYTRARKHIDMDRVKEMREEKIKREQIAELVQDLEKIRAELEYIKAEESKYINWRRELEEGMNTSGMGMVNYPAEGDVDIVDSDTAFATLSGQHGTVSAGTVIVTDDGDNDIAGGTHTAYRVARFTVDGTKSSHVKITISKGGGTSSWTDREESWDDHVTLNITDADNFFAPGYNNTNLSSGTHIIALPGKYRNTLISFEQFAKLASDGSPGTTGALRITNVSVQRRTPVNVFVPLDDPEANSFMRDGQTDNLSPGEKKKKLEEQLASSKEYLNKMFGEGMPNTATTIADYEPQQSFSDIKVSLSPEDLKAISDRVGGSYSGSKGTEIAAAQQGPIPPGPRGYKKPGTYNPDKFYQYRPEKPASPNLPFTGPGYSKGTGDTQVASARGPYGTPGADKPYTRKGYKDKDGKFVDYDNPATWPKIPKASRKQRTMVAHHEPQGEVIREKKTFKDITKKIPGYYDGKPSPLGFPVEEPPKMKNGYHPDLVDGKKASQRYNRLDPISAKAMPPTGNPHIDKKVKAAAKKPK